MRWVGRVGVAEWAVGASVAGGSRGVGGGGIERVGGTGKEWGWTGKCDGDGGGGRQSWRQMKGSACTPRGPES